MKHKPSSLASLATRIQALRLAARLSQREVARRAHISSGHLCLLEKGLHRASRTCLARLAEALGTTLEELLEGVFYRERRGGRKTLHPFGRKLLQAFGAERVPPEPLPTLEVAFREATYTALGLELFQALREQKRPARFFRALKRLVRGLNSYEQLFVLHLLVHGPGADLEEIHPWRLGFRRPVTDANGGRWVAIVLPIEGGFIAVFVQLGVVTAPGRFRTLDALVGVGLGKRPVWFDYEIDGSGHKDRKVEDAERERQLQLTRVAIPLSELESRDFAARFIKSATVRARIQIRSDEEPPSSVV